MYTVKTDQTGQMPRLGALGAHVILLIFSCERDLRKGGYDIKF